MAKTSASPIARLLQRMVEDRSFRHPSPPGLPRRDDDWAKAALLRLQKS